MLCRSWGHRQQCQLGCCSQTTNAPKEWHLLHYWSAGWPFSGHDHCETKVYLLPQEYLQIPSLKNTLVPLNLAGGKQNWRWIQLVSGCTLQLGVFELLKFVVGLVYEEKLPGNQFWERRHLLVLVLVLVLVFFYFCWFLWDHCFLAFRHHWVSNNLKVCRDCRSSCKSELQKIFSIGKSIRST